VREKSIKQASARRGHKHKRAFLVKSRQRHRRIYFVRDRAAASTIALRAWHSMRGNDGGRV